MPKLSTLRLRDRYLNAGPGKSKLDAYQVEITALLKNGATKTWIAKKYGTTRRNLSHWMKQHQITV